MNTPIQTMISQATRFAAVGAVAAALLLAAGPQESAAADQSHAGHGRAPAKLVELVRNATRQFVNVNSATAAGYNAFLGCVSGPDRGAMGVHYVNGPLVADGEIDASKPEALIYEPTADGMRLVGVEFIVDAATWLQKHNNTPPVLENQTFQLVSSPNRYGLPPFFELHVWAWPTTPTAPSWTGTPAYPAKAGSAANTFGRERGARPSDQGVARNSSPWLCSSGWRGRPHSPRMPSWSLRSSLTTGRPARDETGSRSTTTSESNGLRMPRRPRPTKRRLRTIELSACIRVDRRPYMHRSAAC